MKAKISRKANFFKKHISPVRQIMNLADKKYYAKLGITPANIISFSGGWVNHEAPKGLQKAYVDIVKQNDTFHLSGGYSATLGMTEFIETTIRFEKYLYGARKLKPENIAIGASSTQLTFDLFQVLLNPKEKVLLLDPTYCNVPTQITTALDVPVIRFSVLDPRFWKYNAEENTEKFSKYILREKPKVVFLISPDNPTSQVLSDSFIKETLKAVERIGGYLVIDFAYKELTFCDVVPKYYTWGPSENFITLHSHSKWCRGLGRRLGWVEAPVNVIEAMLSLQSSTILCPDTLHQMAMAKYINAATQDDTLRKYILQTKNLYKKTADVFVEALKEYTDLDYLVPAGGLYTALKVDKESTKFSQDILKKSSVVVVPGWGFGNSMKKAVRLSYGPLVHDHEKLRLGIRKIGQYFKKTT